MNRALKLATMVVEGQDGAWELACRIVKEATAHKRRVAAKKAPGRESKASAKAQRAERTSQVRAAVFARDGGRCICGAEATDLHHCLSGPDRMAKEHERTCIAVCRHCHKRLHEGVVTFLAGALERCEENGMLNAAAAIERRIRKVTGHA